MSPNHEDEANLTLDQVVHDIQGMKLRGAARIGRTAATCLARVADQSEDREVKHALASAGRQLVAARPTAVSLRNAVNLTLDGLREPSPAGLRLAVVRRADAYIEHSNEAASQIATELVTFIGNNATILTHCHSSLAVQAISAVNDQRKNIRVFADETRPWWQGHLTVKALHEAGVDVTLIVDSAAHHILESEAVDAVVVGADTITADGSLYNKIGTRAVALGAKAANIPVYVCAEAVKFSPYSLDGQLPTIEERPREEVVTQSDLAPIAVRNPVFDRTSAALVARYITEYGAHRSEEVAGFIRRQYPNTEDWI